MLLQEHVASTLDVQGVQVVLHLAVCLFDEIQRFNQSALLESAPSQMLVNLVVARVMGPGIFVGGTCLVKLMLQLVKDSNLELRVHTALHAEVRGEK